MYRPFGVIMEGILKVILPGLVIAAFSSWLAVRFALRKFHQEKWWDKKHETYIRLLSALHHLRRYYDVKFNELAGGQETPEERAKELSASYDRSHREFLELCDLASFHLGKNSVAVLAEYRRETSERQPDYFSHVDNECLQLNRCLVSLKLHAKLDLRVVKPLRWWQFWRKSLE